jgi:hypothetical protein
LDSTGYRRRFKTKTHRSGNRSVSAHSYRLAGSMSISKLLEAAIVLVGMVFLLVSGGACLR